MTHLTDDEMAELHYGGDAAGARSHLESCESCGARFAGLQKTMGAISSSPVPERDESYGRTVWARLRPQIEAIGQPDAQPRTWWRLASWPRLALAGGAAVLVVGAFVAGRLWQAPAPTPRTTAVEVAMQGQERILMLAVGQHLERSARLLVELTNQNGGATIDISTEQASATDLLAANRLYRQAALRSGEGGLASVLEDLERVLAEITNGASTVSPADVAGLRRRLDDTGLLFKVRVSETQIRLRQPPLAQPSISPVVHTKAG
jgi:hypothetical protein